MSWKNEILKFDSRAEEDAGNTRESILNYAVYEILTLASSRNSVKIGEGHKDLPLKESIIDAINDTIRRLNNISKE